MKPNCILRKRDVGLLPGKSWISPTYLLGYAAAALAEGKAQCPRLYLPTDKVSEPQAMLEDIKRDIQARMGKSVEALRHELSHLRTGRASTALVEGIKVPYYGSDVPLNQVATVAVSDARSLTITPYEKQIVGAVEKAIMASDLGVTPTTAGTVIRLNMPPLTEERRKELAKHVGHAGENAKVAVRNIRRDALQQLKNLLKDKQISEDDDHRTQDEVQAITDRFIRDVDATVQAKEQELLAL